MPSDDASSVHVSMPQDHLQSHSAEELTESIELLTRSEHEQAAAYSGGTEVVGHKRGRTQTGGSPATLTLTLTLTHQCTRASKVPAVLPLQPLQYPLSSLTQGPRLPPFLQAQRLLLSLCLFRPLSC